MLTFGIQLANGIGASFKAASESCHPQYEATVLSVEVVAVQWQGWGGGREILALAHPHVSTSREEKNKEKVDYHHRPNL